MSFLPRFHPNTDDGFDLGSFFYRFKKIFIATGNNVKPRSGFRGVHSYQANADFFFGDDNIYPGYYVQRATVSDSAATDNTDDYSNLYQGDSNFQYLTVNYYAGGDTTASYGNITDLRNGAFLVGEYDSTSGKGGAGLAVFARAGSALYFVSDETNKRFRIALYTSGKAATKYYDISLGGAETTSVQPQVDDQTSLGTTSYRWKDLHLSGALNVEGKTVANITTVTSTTHTAGDESIIWVDDDTAAAQVTVTLPAAADNDGTLYHIKKLGTTANVVIDGNASETIDGATTATLTAQYESISIACNGTSWGIF